MRVNHPLDPLTADEIRAAVAAVRDAHPELERPTFSLVALLEPAKEVVFAHAPGAAVERRARVVVFDRAQQRTYRAAVALEAAPDAAGEAAPAASLAARVDSWEELVGVQPIVSTDDFELVMQAPRTDPRFLAALKRRGITDVDQVSLDALTPGFYESYEEGRRCLWAVPYLKPQPGDNHYAHPIENVRALVDSVTGEVLTVVDGDVVPVPEASHNFDEEAVGGFRTDVKPIDITQPDGTSFTVEGHEVAWQGWRFHVSLHPVEGLVLNHVRHEDGDELRSVLYRAGLSEMVVPYGDPGEGFYWRSYFDAGEYGIGQLTNSLTLGCDCLGEIHYFDGVVADGRGEPRTIRNAICMHEEDDGILWKHTNFFTGEAEVRRSRRLIVSAISTVGNYDYGFFWSFYQDGSIELEIKLTGIVLTKALAAGEVPRHARRVTPELGAPHHQHLFNMRLDMAVDGLENTVYEVDLEPDAEGPGNPHGGAMYARETAIEREAEGRRAVDPVRQRVWKVVNRSRLNAVGDPVAYKLEPHQGPVLLAREGSSVARRAEFARHHLWVTRYAEDELHAAGEFPNQSRGGEGLPRFTAADRPLVDTDVVLWHTVGVSHIVRPEDWPVMPVDKIGFALRPAGFFARNPGLDVPPGAGSAPHCH